MSIYASDRPIIDKTGLTGVYDLKVDLSANLHSGEGRGDKSTGELFLEATLDQLGLKLVAMKSPVEMFVVDNVEKPSAN